MRGKKTYGIILDDYLTVGNAFVEYADIDMREGDAVMIILENGGGANDLDIEVREYAFYDGLKYDTIDSATLTPADTNVTSYFPLNGHRVRVFVKPTVAATHSTLEGEWGSKKIGR